MHIDNDTAGAGVQGPWARIETNNDTLKPSILFAVLLFLLTIVVASTVYAGGPLTFDQAIDMALRNSPGLKAADALVEAAGAGVLKSRSGFLPKATLSETYSKTDNPLMTLGTKLNQEVVSPQDFAPDAVNHPDPASNYNTRLAVTQPVFNGGKEYLGVKQAKLAQGAAVQDRERTRQETIFGVVKAYYGLLQARDSLAVARQSIETSAANVKLAEARYKAGAVLQSDLLRARVQEAEVKELLARSENGAKLAAANLNYAMGVPQGEAYEVSGALSARDRAEDLNAMIASALALRPDLVSLGLNRKNAEAGVSQARTDFIPTLNLMGQADWNSRDFAGDDAKSWAVMAVLQWNFLTGS